jgi:RNA polymerase sigma-70 factor (ECF subfamily)
MNDFKIHANIAGERLLNGTSSALEEIIELYRRKIFSLAFRFTGDREEAFDLCQEIFLRLYSKIKRYSSNTDFNAWFMRLAVNASINYRSRVRRNPSHIALEFCENQDSGTGDNSPDSIELEARQRSVNALLSRLPRRERMAITLQLYEKKKVKEIAELMNTSVKGAEALLTRARKRLKKIIKQSEGSAKTNCFNG